MIDAMLAAEQLLSHDVDFRVAIGTVLFGGRDSGTRVLHTAARSRRPGTVARVHRGPSLSDDHRIPLGLASLKVITVGLRPLGREIVSVDEQRRRGLPGVAVPV